MVSSSRRSENSTFLVVFGVPVPEEFSADPNQYREQQMRAAPSAEVGFVSHP